MQLRHILASITPKVLTAYLFFVLVVRIRASEPQGLTNPPLLTKKTHILLKHHRSGRSHSRAHKPTLLYLSIQVPQYFLDSTAKDILISKVSVPLFVIFPENPFPRNKPQHHSIIFRKPCISICLTVFFPCLILEQSFSESVQALRYEEVNFFSRKFTKRDAETRFRNYRWALQKVRRQFRS